MKQEMVLFNNRVHPARRIVIDLFLQSFYPMPPLTRVMPWLINTQQYVHQ